MGDGPFEPANFNKSQLFSLSRATSRFVHLERLRLNFSSLSFVIRVNLFHP